MLILFSFPINCNILSKKVGVAVQFQKSVFLYVNLIKKKNPAISRNKWGTMEYKHSFCMILIFFFHVARFFPHIICVFPLQIELCEQLHSPGPGHPTDVFMLCFAVDDRPAFQAITHKWLPQLKTTFPFVPVVLVACKIGKFRHIIV